MFYLPKGLGPRPFFLAPLLAWESLFLFMIPYPLRYVLDDLLAGKPGELPVWLPPAWGQLVADAPVWTLIGVASVVLVVFTLAQSLGSFLAGLGFNALG